MAESKKEMPLTKKRQETFKKLLEMDCSKYTKQSPANKANYLSWSYAWQEFKKVYPFAYVVNTKNDHGTYELKDVFGTFFVEVTVHNGGEKSNGEYPEESHTVQLPIMDNKHKPMKAEEYQYTTKYGTKTVAGATSFDTNYALQRAKTKAISDFGLGLYIYHGETIPEESDFVMESKEEKEEKRKLAEEKEKQETLKASVWTEILNSGLNESIAGSYFKTLDFAKIKSIEFLTDSLNVYLEDYNTKLTAMLIDDGMEPSEGFKNSIEENNFLMAEYKKRKGKK